ncbi:hypothetical protein WJX81_004034 [Elliptochloris bilobata]|uniref:Uncharacterized protein n=1 Tax=Elliptochloris bilobata TaxID=381761 RepID=A0AAW1RMG2_9CHLO
MVAPRLGASRITLCNLAAYPPAAEGGAPCAALLLGIGREFAAEAELAARHGCAAWVVDPLVRRRPEPAAGRLSFLRLPFVAAAGGFHDGRALVKVPALAESLGVGRLAALRLDCRGCELGLGAAVEGHGDGDFLGRVDQLSVRLHMGRRWAPGRRQVLEWGRLAFLLRRDGLQVVAARYGPCSGPQAEEGGGGCDELWAAVGFQLVFAHSARKSKPNSIYMDAPAGPA